MSATGSQTVSTVTEGVGAVQEGRGQNRSEASRKRNSVCFYFTFTHLSLQNVHM